MKTSKEQLAADLFTLLPLLIVLIAALSGYAPAKTGSSPEPAQGGGHQFLMVRSTN